jgi:hypothetical protein
MKGAHQCASTAAYGGPCPMRRSVIDFNNFLDVVSMLAHFLNFKVA